MRRALIILAALLSIAARDKTRIFVLRLGEMTMADGLDGQELKRISDLYGKRFAYFKRDGRNYVIRDAATLDRIEAVYAPVMTISAQQGALGQKQGALGVRQARLGSEQASLGLQQAAAGLDGKPASPAVERRMSELSREQNKLGEEQNRLGEQQNALGVQQEDASREAERRIQPLLEQAIRNRVAVEVR